MKTSRQRLLEYIQSQRVVSVADLTRALHMTSANARHHLAILQEQGLVQAAGQRRPEGKGRPARLYCLSERLAGDNLGALAGAMLAEFFDPLDPAEQDRKLKRIARLLRAAGQGGAQKDGSPGSKKGASLTQRLYQAVHCLNQLHYQARWEARADAPRLILGHCPYAAILAEHPELCRLDALFLEELLDIPARQAAKLAQDPRGAKYCLFVVGEK